MHNISSLEGEKTRVWHVTFLQETLQLTHKCTSTCKWHVYSRMPQHTRALTFYQSDMSFYNKIPKEDKDDSEQNKSSFHLGATCQKQTACIIIAELHTECHTPNSNISLRTAIISVRQHKLFTWLPFRCFTFYKIITFKNSCLFLKIHCPK
jgi:hypothetical protein